ncbi:hypothetical protein [Methylovulum psychrotolerans]|uniref:Uncharacterized protein n=1 Tax=Methylovulum psychrotolerans TaxID=1704499 RepID=A0A2S5CIN0_9GAMM|nr:hypothetical protein [Methylovulum psychrotolerans]POZ50670.1 hypothetical protein AADEFJLK_03567 [Methylovulum psychrotolerans]
MTIKTTAECDGFSCCQTLDIDDPDRIETTMAASGWHYDPNDPWTHYCPNCWSKIEIDKERCPGCDADDYNGELRRCPHCGEKKCSFCDMGDDVECGLCDDFDKLDG